MRCYSVQIRAPGSRIIPESLGESTLFSNAGAMFVITRPGTCDHGRAWRNQLHRPGFDCIEVNQTTHEGAR